MRKLFIAVSLVLAILLISGCNSTKNPDTNNSSEQSVNGDNSSTSDIQSGDNNSNSPTEKNESQSDTIQKPSSTQPISGFDAGKISGKITNIYYAGGSKVLITANKLFLYDMATEKILHEGTKETFSEETYFAINDGFVAVGAKVGVGSGGLVATSDGNGMTCVIYNSKLEKIKEIDCQKLMGKDEMIMSPQLLKVSADGTKMVFASDMALYSYDIKTEKNTKLINLIDSNESKRSGLSIFEDLAFISGDSAIAFKSQSFDVPAVVGKPSFDSYGTINVDGTGLSAKRSSDYSVKRLVAYSSTTLWSEDFTVVSGRLMVMNNSDKKTRIINLTTKKESGTVCGSEKGTYFATSMAGDGGIIVRVYDTTTGKKLAEQTIKDIKDYESREPVIRIFDDSKTCVVVLGNRQNSLPTVVRTFSF